ncbi:MAG: pilus assembly protein PilM [Desulfobacterales bacterium]|jgi:type IV pilus assembly protein PilM|nr:pilus assembly protein PilM [Desulfobacterales bacterium]
MAWGKKKNVIGLDIGSSSIKIVELRETKDGFKLQHLGISPLPPEAIVDGALMDSVTIIDTIRDLVTSTSKTRDVVTSVSGHSVIVKKITLPFMTETELEESIQWEAERHIPFDINDVNIDFQILGYRSENPDLMDVILVAAKKDIINDYVSVIMEAGLNPVVMDIEAFALENMLGINYEIEKDDIVAIANLGATVTNINILKDNLSAFTRDIFKGGNQITEEIQRQLHVDYEEAEKIKVGQKGEGASQSVVENALRSASESLAVEIGNSLDFFQSSTTSQKVSKLYLSGGGSKIKDFDIILQQQIGIPVEIANPFKRIEYNEKSFDPEYLREIGSVMAVGVGLASRKVGDR